MGKPLLLVGSCEGYLIYLLYATINRLSTDVLTKKKPIFLENPHLFVVDMNKI